jgi:hypothetical protein
MNLLLLNRNLILVVVECQMISIRFSCLNLHNITTHAYFAIPKFRMIFSTTSFTFRSNQIFQTFFTNISKIEIKCLTQITYFIIIRLYVYKIRCPDRVSHSQSCIEWSKLVNMKWSSFFFFYFLFIQMSQSNLAVFSKKFWCKSLWIYLFFIVSYVTFLIQFSVWKHNVLTNPLSSNTFL